MMGRPKNQFLGLGGRKGNKIEIRDDHAVIFDYKEEEILIDKEDIEIASSYTWFIESRENTKYAASNIPGRTISLHRLLLSPERNQQVDHINHNGLDNRRHNLRLCSIVENRRNSRARPSTSGLKGVYFQDKTEQWVAHITHEKRFIFLGFFDNKEEAGNAYNIAAQSLFREFACINLELPSPSLLLYEHVQSRLYAFFNKKGPSSEYRGVAWNKSQKKWQAYINPKGRMIHLGFFEDETAAALTYNEAAVIHFAEKAKPNQVKGR